MNKNNQRTQKKGQCEININITFPHALKTKTN